MRIVVVYNQMEGHTGSADDLVTDDTVKTSVEICQALSSMGHTCDLFKLDYKSISDLTSLQADIFFNQAWGIGSDENSEGEVVKILEQTGKPYTGASSDAIELTTNKAKTKQFLIKNNLPTPKYQLLSATSDTLDRLLKYPLIVKPNEEDCSIGITAHSVVSSEEQARQKISKLFDDYHETILLEEFIDGRELNVTVLGNSPNTIALPISEILFNEKFANRPKLVSFSAKWEESSIDYQGTLGAKCPAELPLDVKKEIERISIKSFELTGGSDYARVDIRLSKDNTPYILEVNVNCGIGSGDGAVRSAIAAGLTYPQFLQKIIDFALERYIK